MASEILTIPESKLLEVIKVIRAGLLKSEALKISQETVDNLNKWCNEEQEYLDRTSAGG